MCQSLTQEHDLAQLFLLMMQTQQRFFERLEEFEVQIEKEKPKSPLSNSYERKEIFLANLQHNRRLLKRDNKRLMVSVGTISFKSARFA